MITDWLTFCFTVVVISQILLQAESSKLGSGSTSASWMALYHVPVTQSLAGILGTQRKLQNPPSPRLNYLCLVLCSNGQGLSWHQRQVFLGHAKLHLLLQPAKLNFVRREGPQRAIKQRKTEVKSLEFGWQDFTFMMPKWIFVFCSFVSSFINFHLICNTLITN